MAELEEACGVAGPGCTRQRCNLLSELSLHRLDPERARFWATRALALEPDSVTALHHAALAARALGERRSASELVRKCLLIQPRHPGALDLALLLHSDCPIDRRPETTEKIERLRRKTSGLSLCIHTFSDKETDPEMRLLWGDHWVREELAREFTALGFVETQTDPYINIHLFGSPPRNLKRDTLNLVWLHSHPDLVSTENLRPFDFLFCASPHFLPALDAMGYIQSETMPACTSKGPVRTETRFGVVFLGNARESRPDGRAIGGNMMAAGIDFKVWGHLWEGILPQRNVGGRYWDYHRLGELYAGAKITLNDHHPDMEREGFVSNKVFDILASGGFVISGKNKGLASLFGDAVPEYESPEHLRALVAYCLGHSEERRLLAEKGMKIALYHTYSKRALQFVRELIL